MCQDKMRTYMEEQSLHPRILTAFPGLHWRLVSFSRFGMVLGGVCISRMRRNGQTSIADVLFIVLAAGLAGGPDSY